MEELAEKIYSELEEKFTRNGLIQFSIREALGHFDNDSIEFKAVEQLYHYYLVGMGKEKDFNINRAVISPEEKQHAIAYIKRFLANIPTG